MTIYHLRREIDLGCALEEVFPFFSDARNLDALTPPWLHFKILSKHPIEMRVGACIQYQIRLHGIPVRWTSKITEWDPPQRFVDEQSSGPFRAWVHEHTFEKSEKGTLTRDHVQYGVYGGALVDRLFVQRDLKKIFDYRQKRLQELWDRPQPPDVHKNGRRDPCG